MKPIRSPRRLFSADIWQLKLMNTNSQRSCAHPEIEIRICCHTLRIILVQACQMPVWPQYIVYSNQETTPLIFRYKKTVLKAGQICLTWSLKLQWSVSSVKISHNFKQFSGDEMTSRQAYADKQWTSRREGGKHTQNLCFIKWHLANQDWLVWLWCQRSFSAWMSRGILSTSQPWSTVSRMRQVWTQLATSLNIN